MKRVVVCAISVALAAIFAGAQQGNQSSMAEESLKLRGKEITIKYAAPAMEGREIFGDVIPIGKVWPIGGVPAKLHTDSALDVQGLSVPKGDYTLYLLPEEKAWYLIFNRRRKPEDPEQELGRVRMKSVPVEAPIETCKMTLSGRGLAGKLELGWGNSAGRVSFYLDLTKKDSEW